MDKLEVSKTPGGYYRVYKLGKKYATPLSPREFIRKAEAVKWMNEYKRKHEKTDPTGVTFTRKADAVAVAKLKRGKWRVYSVTGGYKITKR